MMASLKGFSEIVQQLLANGADVNAKNKDGATASMMAATDEVRQLFLNGPLH
jgi:ankyrin repeat protein